jgi:hypothetical protein
MKTIADPEMQAISVSRFWRWVGSGPVGVLMGARFLRGTGPAVERY